MREKILHGFNGVQWLLAAPGLSPGRDSSGEDLEKIQCLQSCFYSCFFIGVTMPCPGRMLRAVPSTSPSLPGREERSGGGKGIPAVEMESREELPAVKPLARGSQLGEGWGQGRERTRGAAGQRKPSG